MLLSLLYLAINVLCGIVLLRSRYYRIAPAWCVAQALTCWQITIRLFVPVTDRTTAAAIWTPGECVLIVACIAAVCESLWHSLREWRQRATIYTGLIAGCAFLLGVVAEPPAADAYGIFLQVRSYTYLGLALLSFLALWIGLWSNEEWPRVDRMHAALLAVLMAGHVVLSDWAKWELANLQWRLLESMVCFGFLINCRFLVSELAAVEKSLRAFERLTAAYQAPRLPSDRTAFRA